MLSLALMATREKKTLIETCVTEIVYIASLRLSLCNALRLCGCCSYCACRPHHTASISALNPRIASVLQIEVLFKHDSHDPCYHYGFGRSGCAAHRPRRRRCATLAPFEHINSIVALLTGLIVCTCIIQ